MGTRKMAFVAFGLLVGAVTGACGQRVEQNSALGISPGFQVAAARLHQFVGEQLAQSKDLPTFEARLAQARKQLAELRLKAKTDSDRHVVLLIALQMTKDNQRKRVLFQTSDGAYVGVQHEVASLYNEREQCRTEIDGWLGVTSVKVGALSGGPCLTEARQAVAMLTQFAAH